MEDNSVVSIPSFVHNPSASAARWQKEQYARIKNLNKKIGPKKTPIIEAVKV